MRTFHNPSEETLSVFDHHTVDRFCYPPLESASYESIHPGIGPLLFGPNAEICLGGLNKTRMLTQVICVVTVVLR